MQNDHHSRRDAAANLARGPYWTAAGLVLLFGALIRFYRVGDQIVLDDEWHALNVVQNTDYGFIFSHFGHADHSIPLALLYEWFSRTIGLSELSMRMPSLIAGVLLIAVFPLLMRPWLSRTERVATAALLALSPFLINFSRVARPYALLTLLTACSLPLAWRWWNQERWSFGIGWYFCTVLAAWLNPVSLSLATAPFLWFGAEAIASGAGKKSWRPLNRLLAMGFAMAASVGALLYPPLKNDFVSLTIKSGMDKVDLGTWNVLLTLFSGSGHDAVVVAMASLSLAGLFLLRRRAGSFSAYLALVALASGAVVSMSGAQWIQYGLVPARYLSGLLPVYLVLVAIAMVALAGRLQHLLQLPGAASHGFIVVALFILIATGPLPAWDLTNSQFTHHLANQFDYKSSRNAVRIAHAEVKVEPFYAEIAQQHPRGDAIVVEAPWYLESPWNTLYLSQRVHRQRVLIGFVGGLCAGRLYGELRRDVPGLEFRNFVYLSDLLAGRVSADYLVLRRAGFDGARPIDMDFGKCEKAVRKRFGAPWRSSADALVFKLDPGAANPVSATAVPASGG